MAPCLRMLKKVRKKFPDLLFYLDLDQKLLGFIIHRDPSSIQVPWKSVL